MSVKQSKRDLRGKKKSVSINQRKKDLRRYSTSCTANHHGSADAQQLAICLSLQSFLPSAQLRERLCRPVLTHTKTKYRLLGVCHLPCYEDILCELVYEDLLAATNAFHGRSEKVFLFCSATFNILTQKVADKTHFPNINKCIKKKRGQEKKPENRQQIKQH